MKKHGFTLVELLATIIVLGIIALIATPIVLNVVNKAEEKARQLSMNGYAEAIRTQTVDIYYENNSYKLTANDFKDITYNGDSITCEEVYITDVCDVVLHKCKIGNDTHEYYLAGNKIYTSSTDIEYASIYDSVQGPKLTDLLINQYKESNTTGLLHDTTGYYYKGTNEEVANNFVWFAGHLWRVISIDNANNITMITQQPITSINFASSVWTTEQEYKNSYIHHWLNDMTDGVFLKSMEGTDRDRIINTTFNVGGNYNNTTDKIENIDNITTTQKIGLLDISQYIKSGEKNSFLNINDFFGLGNRYDESSISVIYINESTSKQGYAYFDSPSINYAVRPVIKISNLIITNGEGSISNPYREYSESTSTNNIKVGEYVSVPTSGTDCGEDKRCLFRVISKDSDSIKVILNGTLPNTSDFGDMPYTRANTVDAVITAFANTLSNNYRYIGNKVFNIGSYSDGINYTNVQNATYTGTSTNPVNLGLPVIGEMFSGNDIDITTDFNAKTFVNVNIIENPHISDTFHIMNVYSDNDITEDFECYNDGVLYGYTSQYGHPSSKAVRPVIFLKNNLSFASGDGTAEHPFTLE